MYKACIIISIALFITATCAYSQPIPKAFYSPTEAKGNQSPLSGSTPYKGQKKAMYFYGIPSPINSSISRTTLKSRDEVKELMDNLLSFSRFEYSPREHSILEDPEMMNIESYLEKMGEDARHSTVIIFMSGHGINKDGHYYFAASDTRANAVKSTAISYLDIWKTLERLANKGNNVILFLDTCNAGALIDGFSPSISLGSIAIYASCSSTQNSYEYKQLSGSPYAFYLMGALKGRISSAVNNNGDITYASLENYLEKGLTDTHGQTPQYKMFGQDEITPLFSNVSGINDYLMLLERYEKEVGNIQGAMDKKDFKTALAAAARADAMEIDSRDREIGFTLTKVTEALVNNLRKASPEDMKKLVNGIPYNDGVTVDPTILNESIYLKIEGDAWARKWKEQDKRNSSPEEYLHNAMKNYRASYMANPDNLALFLSVDSVPFSKFTLTKEEMQFIISIADKLSMSPQEYASILDTYLNEYGQFPADESKNKKIISLYENVDAQKRNKAFSIYAAKAYSRENKSVEVRRVLADYVLNNPENYKKEHYLYEEFSNTYGQAFEIFIENLPSSSRNAILLKKERQDRIETGKRNVGDFLSSAFWDTPLRLGAHLQTGLKTYPLGASIDLGYKFLSLSAEFNFGRSLKYFGRFYNIGIGISNVNKTLTDTEILTTAQWCVSPGINIFGFATISLGLGSAYQREYLHYDNESSTSVEVSTQVISVVTSSSTSSTLIEEGNTFKHFILKPGITLYFPLCYSPFDDFIDNCKTADFLLSIRASYVICKSNSALNGCFFGIGITKQFNW